MSRLFDRVRRTSRRNQRSYADEQRTVFWVRRYIEFHGRVHPEQLGAASVHAFLDELSSRRDITPAAYEEARDGLRFLHEAVLGRDAAELGELPAGPRAGDAPRVLNRQEVAWVLDELEEPAYLVVLLLYGAGLRLREALALRVGDLDLEAQSIRVRGNDGSASRESLLPAAALEDLEFHLRTVRALYDADREAGVMVGVRGSDAPTEAPLARFSEFWLFPADSRDGDGRRVALSRRALRTAIRDAVEATGIGIKATASTFRQSFAAHLLQDGTDPRRVQSLLGHRRLETTLRYQKAEMAQLSTSNATNLGLF